MGKINSSLIESIGNTPMVRLDRYKIAQKLEANIFAKLEMFNPSGSVKDRAAIAMIEDAEARGKLTVGSTIIEPTSGNTGIGLSLIGRIKGYRVILTMPETMSVERRQLLSAYGAELVLTEGAKGMKGAIEKAFELKEKIFNSFVPSQFDNPANPKAHYLTTGPEIWNSMDGKIDIFVAGVGTGGTITGVGKYLKEQNKNVNIIAVEPEASAVLAGGQPGSHPIQGIGAGFVPTVLNTAIYDDVMPASGDASYEACRMLSEAEGILAGVSSGAVLSVATKLALLGENKDKNIVVILPDGADRYMSVMYKDVRLYQG